MFRQVLLLLTTAFTIGGPRLPGQRAHCVEMIPSTTATYRGTLSGFLRFASGAQQASLVAELSSRAAGIIIETPAGTLQDVLRRTDPLLVCEDVGNVMHVYEKDVMLNPANMLNYQFQYFKFPGTVGRLRLLLESRLSDEPWHPTQGRRVMREVGGGLPADDSSRPLLNEELKVVTARNVLFKAAGEQIITNILVCPNEEGRRSDPIEYWKRCVANWEW